MTATSPEQACRWVNPDRRESSLPRLSSRTSGRVGWHLIEGGFGFYRPAASRYKLEIIDFIDWLRQVA
jgi:hypothetical protein